MTKTQKFVNQLKKLLSSKGQKQIRIKKDIYKLIDEYCADKAINVNDYASEKLAQSIIEDINNGHHK